MVRVMFANPSLYHTSSVGLYVLFISYGMMCVADKRIFSIVSHDIANN